MSHPNRSGNRHRKFLKKNPKQEQTREPTLFAISVSVLAIKTTHTVTQSTQIYMPSLLGYDFMGLHSSQLVKSGSNYLM